MKTQKHNLRILVLGFVLILLMTCIGPVRAQNYSFAVPDMRMQAYVQEDGAVRLVYDITFENYGAPIDVVDIGLPHSDYNIANMSASIDGVNLTDIRPSEYIDVGVEIHLEGQAIRANETNTLYFEATMPDLIYEDTTDRSYASLQLTPTWFDEELVRGTSYLGIAIYLPPSVEPDEALYQREPFSYKARTDEHTVVAWEWEETRLTNPHPVGVSFPENAVANVIKMSFIDLVAKWLSDNPQVRLILGLISLVLFAVVFFRFSGGTGFSVFAFFAAGLVLLFLAMPFSVLFGLPLMVALIIINENWLRKRTKDYLPPIAQVEGGGIKRGLTAPEAAILLEMPLSKVLTLVIFGMLEKGLLVLEEEKPLEVSVAAPFAVWDRHRDALKDRRDARRKAARDEGTVIHAYEDHFLDRIEQNSNAPVAQINFTPAMDELIQGTVAKIKGFDLSDTQDYYRRIIDRAMEQAQALGEIEQREAYLDKHLPWVMMNENYPTVLTHGGYHYWPMWARRVGRGPSLGGGRSRTMPSQGGRSGGGRTTFGDVAGSFAGWTEATMGGLAASVLPSALNAPTTSGGFVDLRGADRVTGDIFEAMAKASRSSGGGGRSGGGSSCACACAGCACACACAGGGR